MSFYTYKLKLSFEMKIHSIFHISLLQLLKDNLISKIVHVDLLQLFYHEVMFINFSLWFKFNSWILSVSHIKWNHICWFIYHVIHSKFDKKESFLSVILQIWIIYSQILLHNCIHVLYLIICLRMKCCQKSCFNSELCAQYFSKNHNKLIFTIRYDHVR